MFPKCIPFIPVTITNAQINIIKIDINNFFHGRSPSIFTVITSLLFCPDVDITFVKTTSVFYFL